MKKSTLVLAMVLALLSVSWCVAEETKTVSIAYAQMHPYNRYFQITGLGDYPAGSLVTLQVFLKDHFKIQSGFFFNTSYDDRVNLVFDENNTTTFIADKSYSIFLSATTEDGYCFFDGIQGPAGPDDWFKFSLPMGAYPIGTRVTGTLRQVKGYPSYYGSVILRGTGDLEIANYKMGSEFSWTLQAGRNALSMREIYCNGYYPAWHLDLDLNLITTADGDRFLVVGMTEASLRGLFSTEHQPEKYVDFVYLQSNNQLGRKQLALFHESEPRSASGLRYDYPSASMALAEVKQPLIFSFISDGGGVADAIGRISGGTARLNGIEVPFRITYIGNEEMLKIDLAEPAITYQTDDVAININGSATLSVTTADDNAKFCWYGREQNGDKWELLSQYGNSYIFVPSGPGVWEFYCSIANSIGAVDSRIMTVTVADAEPVVAPEVVAAGPAVLALLIIFVVALGGAFCRNN